MKKIIKKSKGQYMGKEVEEMTKEELIKALEHMSYLYQQVLSERLN
jgi:hypothetical protein